MMASTSSGRNPKSLYNSALRQVSHNYHHFRSELRRVPVSMNFDIFVEMFDQGRLSVIAREFGQLEIFLPLLNVGDRRSMLHRMFQAVLDHGDRLNQCLTDSLVLRLQTKDEDEQEELLEISLIYATFLSEAGWFESAERVLRNIRLILNHRRRRRRILGHFLLQMEKECQLKLLHCVSAYCKFSEAAVLYKELLDWVAKNPKSAYASVFCELSSYCYDRSEYADAFDWSMEAVKLLNQDLPPKVIIDVMRQASKSSVVRRQFAEAEILIHEAVLLAKEVYGETHAKYADCLIDYGFYLINVDCVTKSLQVYQAALEVRQKRFGSQNLLVAIAHEHLAYATYVFEYNSGHFERAKGHAEKALEIMSRLLPESHLLLASSQRVLALILEEIAIDQGNHDTSRKLLHRAEELHQSALRLTIKAFGQMNVQTAKHYGNLGRLNQSMERFDKAETMHLKAIEIKEKLLGPNDYEVALSIGHLASLYNYDLKEFTKAESLYLRSISIGLKLFGPSYSGLEYDYRGLIHVYQETQDWANFFLYTYKLRDWKELRDTNERRVSKTALSKRGDPLPVDTIIDTIKRLERDKATATTTMETG